MALLTTVASNVSMSGVLVSNISQILTCDVSAWRSIKYCKNLCLGFVDVGVSKRYFFFKLNTYLHFRN